MNLCNKIIATVFSASMGIAILSGCTAFEEGYAKGSGGGPVTPAPVTNVLPAEVETETVEPEPTNTMPSNDDDRFLWLLDNSFDISDGKVDIDYPRQVSGQMIRVGKAICSDLANGVYSSPVQASIGLYLGQEMFDQDEMHYIVAAATNVYCPWEE